MENNHRSNDYTNELLKPRSDLHVLARVNESKTAYKQTQTPRAKTLDIDVQWEMQAAALHKSCFFRYGPQECSLKVSDVKPRIQCLIITKCIGNKYFHPLSSTDFV